LETHNFHEYKGKRILVTGGAGFIASALVRLIRNVECIILRVDRPGVLWTPINGTAQIQDISGDIRDRSLWEQVIKDVDVVFHFAAQTSTYAANADPTGDIQINVLPLIHLLESCRISKRPAIVLFSSTATIVGIPDSLPVDETHPDNPITIYDLHKLMAEQYLRYYINQGVVHGVALRLANVYGPGPKSSSSDRGILNQMTRRALAGEPLTIYGEGDQLRDYLYVEDAARAFLKAAQHAENVAGQYFVIGSGQGYTIAQAMHLISERVAMKTGIRAPVVNIEPPMPQSRIEYRDFVANPKRFHQATGWRARYSLIDGIDSTIEVLI
jgi:nucleoside-diphosphate-sugar epimerase